MSDIEKWLKKYDLGEYAKLFNHHKIDFVVLRSLTENDLERFGIHKMSDRVRMMRLIQKEKNLRFMYFFVALTIPGLASLLFFAPFFDFSSLETADFKDVSGIEMVNNVGKILQGGIENSVEKMYLFSMLILPISIIEIIFIVSFKQDDLLYKRGYGFIIVQLIIICANVYFIAVSLGYNEDGIGFYQFGKWGYFTYLFLCFVELMVQIVADYNSGDEAGQSPKKIIENTDEEEPAAFAQPDKELLRKLMGRNETAEVLETLTQYYSSIQKREPDDFVLLKGQYEESRRMKNMGIIEHIDNREENRIKLALMELVERL